MPDFDLPEVHKDNEISRILRDTEAFLTKHPPSQKSSFSADGSTSLQRVPVGSKKGASGRSSSYHSLIASQNSKKTRRLPWILAGVIVLMIVAAMAYYGFS